MKSKSIASVMFVIICMIISVLTIPVIADDSDTVLGMPSGTPRENYKAYYNKTFSIDPSWEYENVSVVVFVQTTDQTVKADSSGNYNFNSAEVLQSTVNDLDGGWVTTTTSRHVLAELFTSEYCGFCPGAVGAMDRIARDSTYYPSKMSLIEWHPNSGGYADKYGFPESDSRISFYFSGQSMGYPTSIFDGDIEAVGGSSSGNTTSIDTTYKGHINTRTAVASPLDITTYGKKTSSSGWVNVSVELASSTTLKNLEVNFIVVEDVYPAMKGTAYLRYTARDVLTPESFVPPNHVPTVANPVGPISILEDMTDTTSIDLDLVFDDEDLDDLTFTHDKEGSFKEHITVSIDTENDVTLTPDDDWNGVENITFYADDGRSPAPVEHTVKVTVTAVNDPPYVENPMTDFNILEDTTAEDKFDLNLVFKDVDTDPTLNTVPQEPLVFDFSGNEYISVIVESGLVTFTPDSQWNGEETITFTATDPASSYITDDVKVSVKSENDPPNLAGLISDITFDEDTIAAEVLDLTDYFTDPDGDTLTYTYSGNVDIYVFIDTMGKVTLTPKDDFNGKEMITISATDNIGDPVSTSFNVTVNPINDAPILDDAESWDLKSSDVTVSSEDTLKISEDDLFNVIVSASDPADGDTLTYSDDATLFDIDSSTGEISFTPTNDDVGTYKFNITVDDGASVDNTDTMMFKIVVENTNDPPVAPTILSPSDGDVFTVGDTIDFKGSCDDPDLYIPDSTEVLSYTWTSNKVTEDDLGYGEEISIDTLEVGEHEITLTVKDKKNSESSATIKITIDIDKTTDTDKDGTPDYIDEDDDDDGLPDEWEEKYKLDPYDPTDAEKDSDGDGFSNLEEYQEDTDPRRRSSTPASEISSGDDDDEEDDYTMYYILALIAVIVIVVLVVFMMMRKKKGKEEETGETGTDQIPPVGEDARVPEPGAEYGMIPPPPMGMIPPPEGGQLPPPPMMPPQQQPGDMYTDPYQQPQDLTQIPPPQTPIEQPSTTEIPMDQAPSPEQPQQPVPQVQPKVEE
jgi:hypothetical protein